MKMSDKDLDQLFSSQLADMEIEPSASVWKKIKPEIENKEDAKQGTLTWLQIAAAVVILATAAFMLRPQTGKVALHGEYSAAKVNTSPNGLAITPQANPGLGDIQVSEGTRPEAFATPKHRYNDGRTAVVMPLINKADTTHVMIARIEPTETHDAAQQQISQPVTPEVKLINNPQLQNNQPVKTLAANNVPVQKETPVAQKKKIRSLGDLFNVVIAKVDKRPNKIIQFKDNDDDDSEFGVSGVNLGPIQIKKND